MEGYACTETEQISPHSVAGRGDQATERGLKRDPNPLGRAMCHLAGPALLFTPRLWRCADAPGTPFLRISAPGRATGQRFCDSIHGTCSSSMQGQIWGTQKKSPGWGWLQPSDALHSAGMSLPALTPFAVNTFCLNVNSLLQK